MRVLARARASVCMCVHVCVIGCEWAVYFICMNFLRPFDSFICLFQYFDGFAGAFIVNITTFENVFSA